MDLLLVISGHSEELDNLSTYKNGFKGWVIQYIIQTR